jgi:hypothetical protein
MVRGVMNLNLEADRTGTFGTNVWKNFRQMLASSYYMTCLDSSQCAATDLFCCD